MQEIKSHRSQGSNPHSSRHINARRMFIQPNFDHRPSSHQKAKTNMQGKHDALHMANNNMTPVNVSKNH